MGCSFMGHVCKTVINKVVSMNPEKAKDPVKKVRLLELLFFKSPNVGFKREVVETKSGIKYEMFRKKKVQSNGRIVVFLHGGAYITPLISIYRKSSKSLCKAWGANEAIFLEYDCAPQFKYPTQENQARAFWNYIINDLGYKEENIVIGGDSAGANLALNLMLHLRDEGKPLPKTAFCVSPWADMTGMGDSYKFNYKVDDLFGNSKGEFNEELRQKFMDCGIYSWCVGLDRYDPYISPVYADYKDFPPTFFTVGSHELLLSDTMTIYNNMKKNGVKTDVEVGDEMFHIYPYFRAFIPEGRKAWKKILEFISENK